MTAPFDPFGLVAERARVRKVFGLPPLTSFDVEADVWAAAERVMLGDLSNWQPTGLLPVLGAACGQEIRYVTPLGAPGSESCDLAPDHEGDCDSSNLLLRPADALKLGF